MTKIEITDAMVERAVKAGYRWQGPGGYVVDDAAAHARTLLDAALNPPPEPEIEVTKEMQIAGETTWKKHWGAGGNLRQVMIPDIYRAMRALEPKSISAAHPPGMQGSRLHKRRGEPAYYSHDRKEDRR